MLSELSDNTIKEKQREIKFKYCFLILILFIFISLIMYIYNIINLVYNLFNYNQTTELPSYWIVVNETSNNY